ncbi:MAG: BlaI/MecI/CopY family transcriptional regulator [Planctomycetales bacterium]|nr:BlaI/MecI/CopY family transcriptional regulator [Planctomycetales bacterium]
MQDDKLSRRERQILNVVYSGGELTAIQIWQQMEDPPTRTAVRTMLRILEEKGHLHHRKEGREFLYSAVRPREDAGKSALAGVLQTFFDGSLERAVASHLSDPKSNPDDSELKRLAELVRRARKRENG